jgi:predicted nucleic acid-binding protein
MRVLIDTNVALDVLLSRQPYCREASRIIILSEKEVIEGYISASAVTDIYYITRKSYKDKQITIDLIKNILKIISIATTTENNIYQALDLEWNDFEDSVQYVVGASIPVDYIITRNVNDFKNSTIKCVTPEQFINIISYGE